MFRPLKNIVMEIVLQNANTPERVAIVKEVYSVK